MGGTEYGRAVSGSSDATAVCFVDVDCVFRWWQVGVFAAWSVGR